MESKEDSLFQVTDRRFWVEDESAVDNACPPEDKYPSFVEKLKARTELAEQKLREKVQQLDEENEALRLRLNKQLEQRLEHEKFKFFQDFLEVIDNLERALQFSDDTSSPESLREGVRLNLDLFLRKLKSQGIEPLEILHQPFDPNEAEAVGVVAVKDPKLDQRIVEVLQRGFRWGDRLLRPARVRTGQHQPDDSSD